MSYVSGNGRFKFERKYNGVKVFTAEGTVLKEIDIGYDYSYFYSSYDGLSLFFGMHYQFIIVGTMTGKTIIDSADTRLGEEEVYGMYITPAFDRLLVANMCGQMQFYDIDVIEKTYKLIIEEKVDMVSVLVECGYDDYALSFDDYNGRPRLST
ncbi:hypothetical protein PCE1_004702 [Barthelona sp. PCE]